MKILRFPEERNLKTQVKDLVVEMSELHDTLRRAYELIYKFNPLEFRSKGYQYQQFCDACFPCFKSRLRSAVTNEKRMEFPFYRHTFAT